MGKSLPSEGFLASAVSVAALSVGAGRRVAAAVEGRLSGYPSRISRPASGTCDARVSF